VEIADHFAERALLVVARRQDRYLIAIRGGSFSESLAA
jgi:hypothetical protein